MTIIVGDFNMRLTEMDRSSKQKIKKETMAFHDTQDRMDLNIFRTFHHKAAEYTLFSSAHGTFSRIDQYSITNQASTSTNDWNHTICIFRPQCYEIWNQPREKKTGNTTNTWRLNNILLKNEWVNQKIKEEIKKYM